MDSVDSKSTPSTPRSTGTIVPHLHLVCHDPTIHHVQPIAHRILLELTSRKPTHLWIPVKRPSRRPRQRFFWNRRREFPRCRRPDVYHGLYYTPIAPIPASTGGFTNTANPDITLSATAYPPLVLGLWQLLKALLTRRWHRSPHLQEVCTY